MPSYEDLPSRKGVLSLTQDPHDKQARRNGSQRPCGTHPPSRPSARLPWRDSALWVWERLACSSWSSGRRMQAPTWGAFGGRSPRRGRLAGAIFRLPCQGPAAGHSCFLLKTLGLFSPLSFSIFHSPVAVVTLSTRSPARCQSADAPGMHRASRGRRAILQLFCAGVGGASLCVTLACNQWRESSWRAAAPGPASTRQWELALREGAA